MVDWHHHSHPVDGETADWWQNERRAFRFYKEQTSADRVDAPRIQRLRNAMSLEKPSGQGHSAAIASVSILLNATPLGAPYDLQLSISVHYKLDELHKAEYFPDCRHVIYLGDARDQYRR